MSFLNPTLPHPVPLRLRRRSDGSLFFSDSDLDHSCLTSDDDDPPDLEAGHLQLKEVRNCRICHLSFTDDVISVSDDDGDDEVCWEEIVLGCDCKGDLGSAHRHCAQTWFKIKGNSTCEICGVIARNIGGENDNANEMNGLEIVTSLDTLDIRGDQIENERVVCTNRRMITFLIFLAVVGFIVSWLFHLQVLTPAS